jgi:PhzF family phenazine biosynthesis protein
MQNVWVVNAFGTQVNKGNPAGVCLVDEFPEQAEMQEVAYELGFSNTAFVKNIDSDKFQIRWFTPDSEAPLCGHATIGSMHVLIEEKMISPDSEVTFESQSGNLFVTRTDTWYNLNFPAYITETITPTKQMFKITDAQPIFVGVGQNCLFFELASEKELKNLNVDLELLKTFEYRALIATCKGEKKYDFMSRYFAPKVGIDEDPVCASAHCRLIPYWAQKLQKREMLAYQASSRGGIIKCQNLGNRVLISGEAVTVFKGNVKTEELKKLRYVA